MATYPATDKKETTADGEVGNRCGVLFADRELKPNG
jgi:hypothetical protein